MRRFFVLAVLAVQVVAALRCYEGRAVNSEIQKNDANVPFAYAISERECADDHDECCLLFEVSWCCSRDSKLFIVTDGTCGNASMCERASREAVCDAYGSKMHDCIHRAFPASAGNLTNVLTTFDYTKDAALARRPTLFALAVPLLVVLRLAVK